MFYAVNIYYSIQSYYVPVKRGIVKYFLTSLDKYKMSSYTLLMKHRKRRKTRMERFITGSEVSKYFGVTKETIGDWRKTLGLPGQQFANARRGEPILYQSRRLRHGARNSRRGNSN